MLRHTEAILVGQLTAAFSFDLALHIRNFESFIKDSL